jgi:CHAD domain-containing protein
MLQALVLLPVKPSRDADPSDASQLHELRILYKELRYAAELFEEALPLDLAALAAPAARFQKRLGDIHDVDVALATLARARGLSSETSGRVTEALTRLRARNARKYLDDMAPTPRVDEPEPAPPQPVGVVALRKISTV